MLYVGIYLPEVTYFFMILLWFYCLLTSFRLRVIRTQHHVEARVEHRDGRVVVSACTREWAIKKHLYSTRNVVACESVGRVLAERCLEAGINFMVYQPTPWEAASDSVCLFSWTCLKGVMFVLDVRYLHNNNSSIYRVLFLCQTLRWVPWRALPNFILIQPKGQA